MKLTQHSPAGLNLISRYGADFVEVGAARLHASCIIGPQVLIEQWPPRDVPSLTLAHLEPLFAHAPELVLLSTGERQRFPSAALRAEFAARKIGMEVMEIGAAARTYNVLVSEERNVLAAILLAGGDPSRGSE